MESLFNTFADLVSPFNKIMPIEAVWLNDPVITDSGKKWRIKAGDKVRVRLDRITNISHNLPATHRIVRCKGNLVSSVLQVELENLETKELSTLNLK